MTTVPALLYDTIDEKVAHMLDFEIEPALVSSLIVMVVLIVLGAIVGLRARKALKNEEYKKRPSGLMFYAEQYVNFVDHFAVDTMGYEVFEPWGGYFFTLFAYLFIAFNFSLIGLPSVIDWLAAPLSLAIIMFVIIQYQGLKWSRWSYFHRYVEPIAVFLPVNLITMWSPILSTTMRLFGNALSGTIIIGIIQWALSNLSGVLFGSLTAMAQAHYFPLWDPDQSVLFPLFRRGADARLLLPQRRLDRGRAPGERGKLPGPPRPRATRGRGSYVGGGCPKEVLMTDLGLIAIAAAIAVGIGCLSAIGEAIICSSAIKAMARQPEMQKKLQSTMVLAVALDESTAIYCLVVAILIIFVLGGRA